MRRKTIKLLAAVIAVFTICIGLSGCTLGGNREPNYRLDIAKEFGIMIPEEWKTVYYNSGSLGGWHGDGDAYYVFEVSERDEEFFSEFSLADFARDIFCFDCQPIGHKSTHHLNY